VTQGLTPGLPAFHAQTDSQAAASNIRCHFCHALGHYKPNCRKWQALSQSEQYQQRNSHETKYQLIYDHLEDSVLAPRLCQYCADDNCDGQNCESPFNHEDYSEASLFFTESLSQLVVNAKLDRSLDSHAPQTEHLYHYEADDWGEQYENEYEVSGILRKNMRRRTIRMNHTPPKRIMKKDTTTQTIKSTMMI
jgi:hypothetical protein